ncbi:MAG: hypothetical protein Q4A82_00990 [Corynebacterium sp.]|nr:hypothetical protein [Corynebacterium sp.]
MLEDLKKAKWYVEREIQRTTPPQQTPNPIPVKSDIWEYIDPIDRPDIAALLPQYQDDLLQFAQLVAKHITSRKNDTREDVCTAGVLSQVHLRHTAYDFIDISYSTLDHHYWSRITEGDGLCRIEAQVIINSTTIYDPWADQDEKDNNND